MFFVGTSDKTNKLAWNEWKQDNSKLQIWKIA